MKEESRKEATAYLPVLFYFLSSVWLDLILVGPKHN